MGVETHEVILFENLFNELALDPSNQGLENADQQSEMDLEQGEDDFPLQNDLETNFIQLVNQENASQTKFKKIFKSFSSKNQKRNTNTVKMLIKMYLKYYRNYLTDEIPI